MPRRSASRAPSSAFAPPTSRRIPSARRCAHMTTTDMPTGPGRSLECDALAPLLALRDTGLLDAAEAARVEEHIASCQACRRDAALDGALADHLRGALLPPAHVAPALTVEQITEAAATATDESDAASADSVGAYPAEARRAVRPRSAVARRLSALPALAAALAVAILAAYIFGSRVGPGAGPRPMPAATLSPTLAQQTVFLPTDVGIYALRASDGKLRWTFPAGIETTPIQHSQPIGDLALDQGTLYALAAPPGTLAQP